MEQLQAEGKTRSIGVSNYRIADLEETLKTTKVSFSGMRVSGKNTLPDDRSLDSSMLHRSFLP